VAEAILTAGDHLLLRLSRGLAPLWRALGEIEGDLLARRLEGVAIDRPVFVAGLARSGTTMLLTLLSQADGVATHRYRDFPFLFAPVAWNWLQDRLGAEAGEAVERPHRDRIRITMDSPEAFEEPLWQSFFPSAHDAACSHVLGAETRHAGFEACFGSHLRKILWLRGGSRYVSKGNYNVARIGYLARLFPGARFVVPVRDPVAHVRSLVEQHALFCRYAAQDPRVPAYLAAAGHYEFGLQRRPLNLDAARIGEIDAAWRGGDEHRGYARQWAQVYAHIERLRRTPGLGDRILVVRYEDACAQPQELCRQLLAFCGLQDPGGRVAAAAGELRAAEREPDEAGAEAIWPEVAVVARQYGYTRALPS
jgi:hypothetical protein